MCSCGRVLQHYRTREKHKGRFAATPQTCCGRTLWVLGSGRLFAVKLCNHNVLWWEGAATLQNKRGTKGSIAVTPQTCCGRTLWVLGSGRSFAVMFATIMCSCGRMLQHNRTTEKYKGRFAATPQTCCGRTHGHWEAGVYSP